MFTVRKGLAFVAASVLVFGLWGCGGGGGGGSSSAPTSTTVTGQVQASYINGVKVCVDETVGTANENCTTTSNQGNFTLQNALGKKLSLLLDTVPIGSISADQVVATVTITPLTLANGDATKEQKIKAIFHQAGATSDNITYDLSTVKGSDINATALSNYLAGTINTLTIGTKEVVGSWANVNLNGAWIITGDAEFVYFVSDGNGTIPKGGIYNLGNPPGTYSVQSNGSFAMTINADGGVNFTGNLSSSSVGSFTSPMGAGSITKVSNMAACQGTWSGTLTETNNSAHPIQFSVDSSGNVTSFTGFTGPVSGQMFCDGGKAAAYFKTGLSSSNAYNQFSFAASWSGNAVTGNYYDDRGPGVVGIVSITKQ